MFQIQNRAIENYIISKKNSCQFFFFRDRFQMPRAMSSEGQRTVDLFLLLTVFIFSSRRKRISKDNKNEESISKRGGILKILQPLQHDQL